jgi:hypothetical protein
MKLGAQFVVTTPDQSLLLCMVRRPDAADRPLNGTAHPIHSPHEIKELRDWHQRTKALQKIESVLEGNSPGD